jgi:undecaprenyl-phosphate 4-deoxy-4-formamido-L-arabinose transferase
LLKLATGFSAFPLRMVALLGGAMSLLAFVFAAYFVVQTLIWSQGPEGWASVIVATLFIGGVQLIGIGAVGEYVGRIFVTQNARPQFTIKEICRSGAAEDQDLGRRDRVGSVVHFTTFGINQE